MSFNGNSSLFPTGKVPGRPLRYRKRRGLSRSICAVAGTCYRRANAWPGETAGIVDEDDRIMASKARTGCATRLFFSCVLVFCLPRSLSAMALQHVFDLFLWSWKMTGPVTAR